MTDLDPRYPVLATAAAALWITTRYRVRQNRRRNTRRNR